MKKAILIFILFAFPASAQILQDTKTDAIRFGAQSGKIAGSAYFCQIDEEDLDVFISLSQGKIISLSVDKADRIVGHLEFSNNYSLWAAEPPTEGCDQFIEDFYRTHRNLFQN